jgi:large subunit ribosomal protein L6
MSRLAKKPLKIPQGVEVKVEGNVVRVKGPKGELTQEFLPYVRIEVEGDEVWVRPNEDMVRRRADWKRIRMFQGTYWSILRNMIVGVTEGYRKELEIVGIGYRAQMQGSKLVMQLGYSHPVVMEVPKDLKVEVPQPNRIIVSGIDKQKVGQFAAEVRAWRPPNVYTGKGIRYVGEVVRQKQGKKA